MLAIPDFLEACSSAIEFELQKNNDLPYVIKNIFEITAKNANEAVATRPTICLVFNSEENVNKDLTGVREDIASLVDFSVVLVVSGNIKDKFKKDHAYLTAIKKALSGGEIENFTNILFTDTTVDYIENMRIYMISFKCFADYNLNGD